MTPRVLLLQEDQARGGVSTIGATLCQGLRHQHWQVETLALNHCGWRARWLAARRCDVLLASHNFKPAYVAWVLGKLARKPVVVWVHGPLQEVLAQAQATSGKRAWLRWLYRALPHLVFVSQSSRDSFERFLQGPKPGAVVIPNAVAQDAFGRGQQPTAEAEPGTVRLAFVGRLSAEKRPALLLEALRLLPSRFQLTLVGDGPMRDELRHGAADLLASGRLSLAGAQPHGPGLYAPWDVTLLASSYEGCPMTLLESFAAGVPCVGVPIAALQEVLGDDAPDLLAREASAQALADAVLAVCAMPRERLQADMARVLARHRMDDFVQRWQDLLQRVARRC